MNVWHLILREIGHRRLNFLLGIISVAVGVGVLIGALTLVRLDESRTAEAAKKLQDAMRKITKGLGFNVVILPQNQDLHKYQLEGIADATMPESLVTKLANTDIVTINHLLPVVTRRVKWTEQEDLEVVLIGTRGEATLAHRDPKKPLLDLVPRGRMEIGHQVAKERGLDRNQTVTLMDHNFIIAKVHQERGTIDDSTIWINLAEAQEMLNMENLINAIKALECNCASDDRVAEIRSEIAGILPGTQVIEQGAKALARAEARNKAKQTAEASLAQHKKFAKVLVPLVGLASAVWIALLAFGNVRQRSAEIGILRAIGLRAGRIFGIFLCKALLIGTAGALLGSVAGMTAGAALAEGAFGEQLRASLANGDFLLLAIVAAMFLSLVGAWLPALQAARQDPSMVLHEE